MPPQVDLSTKQLVTIILVTGAIAGVIGGLVDSAIPEPFSPIDVQSEEPSDPDERPPVIINNGSILFEPQDKTGSWDGSDKTYKHNHPYLPVTAFRINMSGGDPYVCKHSTITGDYAPPFTTTVDFTVAFGPATEAQWQKATVSLDGGVLKISFSDPPEKSGKTLTLFKGRNDVAIRRLIVGPSGNQYTCNFKGENTKLRIRQLK
jgi:hypothetical protein